MAATMAKKTEGNVSGIVLTTTMTTTVSKTSETKVVTILVATALTMIPTTMATKWLPLLQIWSIKRLRRRLGRLTLIVGRR